MIDLILGLFVLYLLYTNVEYAKKINEIIDWINKHDKNKG